MNLRILRSRWLGVAAVLLAVIMLTACSPTSYPHPENRPAKYSAARNSSSVALSLGLSSSASITAVSHTLVASASDVEVEVDASEGV